jgi:hypothetical protein
MKGFCRVAVVVALGMWATAARGDGGTMLLHQDAGPFTITLFAAPQPLQAGPADLSVMVQDRSSGEVLLDSMIDVSIAPEVAVASQQTGQQTVRLATGQASNRLLQAGTVHFSKAGRWRLTLVVHRHNDTARLETECIVQADTARSRLVWFYVLMPLGVILVFIFHQRLKLSQEVR